MTGWLIVNHYLKNKRFEELYASFQEAAKKLNIELIRLGNSELMGKIMPEQSISESLAGIDKGVYPKPDFVLFWDKDIKLARMLEHAGYKVYNSAGAIELCDDKALTNISLMGKGIRMPKTFVSPLIYFQDGMDIHEFIGDVEKKIPYPMVVKECRGSFGEQVSLVYTRKALLDVIKAKGNIPFIIQEFIESSAGRDIRIYVAGGKARAAIMRYNDNDFRANYTVGAGMTAYNPTKEQTEMAEKAADALGLDFGGIDILFGHNGEPVFCEANSNAHFKKLYTVTGINMAEEILKCILDKCE